MLIGVQEQQSVSADVRSLPFDGVAAQDTASAAASEAEELLLEHLEQIGQFVVPGLLDRLQLPHYIAGWTTYVPDGIAGVRLYDRRQRLICVSLCLYRKVSDWRVTRCRRSTRYDCGIWV